MSPCAALAGRGGTTPGASIAMSSRRGRWLGTMWAWLLPTNTGTQVLGTAWRHWDSSLGTLGHGSGALPHQSHGSFLIKKKSESHFKSLQEIPEVKTSFCSLIPEIAAAFYVTFFFYKFRAWGLWHQRPEGGVNDFLSLLGNLSHLLSQFSQSPKSSF